MLLLSCFGGTTLQPVQTAAFRMEPANRGPEPYSAWFADTDGRVLYFGLSPFWLLWWRSGGDALADLEVPGDHLIGRFDLQRELFLPPLRVCATGPRCRGSVWDVLVHSNGRIYFTTYFEEIGSVEPDGSDLHIFEGIGWGFNELYEGPDGHLFVTRYSDDPLDATKQRYGALVELTSEGRLLREVRFEKRGDRFTAPKSVAVDPISGEIWINSDIFPSAGRIRYERIRLAPDGAVLLREPAPPELHFVTFDPQGRGYFAESFEGMFRLRITSPDHELLEIPLGPREGVDFVQDIHVGPSGVAALAFWSGRVTLIRPVPDGYEQLDLRLTPPRGCPSLRQHPLLYSAFVFRDRVYATLHCGGTVLRATLPEGRSRWRFWPASPSVSD